MIFKPGMLVLVLDIQGQGVIKDLSSHVMQYIFMYLHRAWLAYCYFPPFHHFDFPLLEYSAL